MYSIRFFLCHQPTLQFLSYPYFQYYLFFFLKPPFCTGNFGFFQNHYGMSHTFSIFWSISIFEIIIFFNFTVLSFFESMTSWLFFSCPRPVVFHVDFCKKHKPHLFYFSIPLSWWCIVWLCYAGRFS